MINLDIEGDLPEGITAGQVEALAKSILASEAPDTFFYLDLKLVDANEMREYNRQYRGVDSSTDILSFQGEEMLLNGVKSSFSNIIIDTNQVFNQKGLKTYKEEFWQVLIHGLLHICGYDHIKTQDKHKMEDAEENYRKLIPGGRLG